MKLISRRWLGVAALVIMAASTQASVTIIYDNLSATPNTNIGAISDAAQRFLTPSAGALTDPNDTILSTITLSLGNVNASEIRIRIFADDPTGSSGGMPDLGTLLYTVYDGAPIGSFGNVQFTPDLFQQAQNTYILHPNTYYWLAFDAPNSTADAKWNWTDNGSLNNGAVAQPLDNADISDPSAVPPPAFQSGPFMMKVEVVPEPSSLALLLLSGAGLLVVRRKLLRA